jgi:hypothetical protein
MYLNVQDLNIGKASEPTGHDLELSKHTKVDLHSQDPHAPDLGAGPDICSFLQCKYIIQAQAQIKIRGFFFLKKRNIIDMNMTSISNTLTMISPIWSR